MCLSQVLDDAPCPFPHSKNSPLFLQGYFLLFESMLDSVLHARDLYLADNGSGRFTFFCFKRRLIRSCAVGWSDISFSQILVVFLVCWCGQWYRGWRRLRGFLAPEISSQGSQGFSRDFQGFFHGFSRVSEGFGGFSINFNGFPRDFK